MKVNEVFIHSVRNPIMCLITKAQMRALRTADHSNTTPIIKLFMGCLTWLVTEIDSDGILWGYADIGQGQVEFGTLCHVSELPTLKVGPAYIERDYYFKPVPGTKYLEMESLVGI